MKKQHVFLILLFVIVLAVGCTPKISEADIQILKDNLQTEIDKSTTLENELINLKNTLADKDILIAELIESNKNLRMQIDNAQAVTGPILGNSLLNEALTVVTLLANQDAAGLDLYVSPTNGVRFSPYSFVDVNTDIVLTAGNSVPVMFTSNTVYLWGTYDGSGESISNNPSGYYSEFIYDHDFQNPDVIGLNTFIGTGNIMNNITTAYPNASFVEFHFYGFDPQYEGMDWSSLILVFENDNGYWYLVGVVHNQWTI